MPLEVKKGSELRGRYVISDLLGVGGFAIVWRATDKQEGRDVAIKRLLQKPGNDIGRLLSEARKTAKLRGHKNIVEIYEVFEEDGEGFLVMEYVNGHSLEELLRQHIMTKAWIDMDEALDYFRQTVEGLLFAHSSGLYHRDVKPSNILVSTLGIVKLVDFGLARPMVPEAVSPPLGESGLSWAGTPNFMSPEQAKGEPLDHLTDIFSAGIVGYMLLTGKHPFNHPSAVTSVFDLIREQTYRCEETELAELKRVPAGVPRLISRMLEKDKTERCQSLIEVLTELTKESAQSCPNCGAPNSMSNSFCGQCGVNLRKQPEVAAAAPAGAATVITAEVLTDQGFALAREFNWGSAIDKYREAISKDPAYARAYSNLGYALNRLGYYQEAIDELTKGLEICNDDAICHRLLDARGFSRSNLKDYDGAIHDFTEALKLNDGNPRVWQHRAESKALAQNYDSAYSDILVALKLDPDYPAALRLKSKLEKQGLVRPLVARRPSLGS